MIRSLRGRLFIGLTAIIILTGAISGMFAFNWAFDEAIEMQDSILTQIASLAQNSGFSGGQPLPGVEEDAEVWIMELGKAPHGSADDLQLWSYQDGLQVATRAGQPIRALLRTRADGSRFAVAQPTAVRDETARDMALRTLVPIAALIPSLMLVTALLIAQSLRPMVRLARDLDARRADDVSPLPLKLTAREFALLQALLARPGTILSRSELERQIYGWNAAHELRTPIAALSLQAENLDPVDLPAAARDRLAALKQGMHRTKHLLEQLLALARQEAHPFGPGEMPPVSLDHVTKEVVADLLPQALNRNIDLGFELVEPLAVPSESVMLAAMIRNLLDNALRYTPEGGNVDIGVYRQDGAAILQIEDSGPGIESSDMDRIFEPFFRGAREEVEGTGLGLSIVKRVVDGLGGSIALENITGIGRSGLRVTVKLPLSADPGVTQDKRAKAST